MYFPLIAFLVFVYIEVQLFAWLAEATNGLWVLVQIVATTLVGLQFVRWQGLQTLYRARERSAQGQLPAAEMLEGTLLALAGLLVLLPGILTDTVGLFLLLPFVRRGWAGQWLQRRARFSSAQQQTQSSNDHSIDKGPASRDSTTIEGEYSRDDDNK